MTLGMAFELGMAFGLGMAFELGIAFELGMAFACRYSMRETEVLSSSTCAADRSPSPSIIVTASNIAPREARSFTAFSSPFVKYLSFFPICTTSFSSLGHMIVLEAFLLGFKAQRKG